MTLFVSQSLERLADALNEQLLPGFAKQPILVPNTYTKRWLLLALAKRRGIAMGLQIFTPSEWLVKQGFMSPNSLEMRCLVYRSLQRCQDPELQKYLASGPGRLLDLTEPLSTLFFEYGQFGKELLQKKDGWQEQILQELFVQGPWKLPVQWFDKAPVASERVHCFGIDSLAPGYWEWLLRFPSLSIYLFSPCLHYWADVCSQKERRQRLRYWRKQEVSQQAQEQLEMYLSETPSLLGNWGKLGKDTLKFLDPWELEVEECYEEREEISLLHRLQGNILTFRIDKLIGGDDSVRIVRTGASVYREVLWLRDEIVRLVAQENLSWDEVTILAPKVDKYAPWISLLFTDIPYRIYGVEEGHQSPFSRGLFKLAELAASQRWSRQEVWAVLEASSFARKQNWSLEELETLKKWMETVDWGFDAKHRQEVLPHFQVGGQDSWEMGLDALLDRIVFFKEGFQVDPDLFEELLIVFQGLKKELLAFQSETTLALWADRLEGLAAKYLFVDSNDENDATCWSSFRQLLANLRQSGLRLGDEKFPLALIEQFLRARSVTEVHASQLHAVRIAPLEEGSLVPTRALFLVGMDEESFPARDHHSSLNLLKKQKSADIGRYHFLQAIFSTTDFLRISYGHLSPKEGKEVAPSLVVQELLSELDLEELITTLEPEQESEKLPSCWLKQSLPEKQKLPKGEVVIAVRDLILLARHPWKFYLQKTAGMFLADEREDSFEFLKARCLRASLDKPLEEVWQEEKIPHGVVGDALRLEMKETRDEWEKVLERAGAKPLISLQLSDFVVDMGEDLKVRIVGEIANVSPQGLVITGDDHLQTVLKAWPEALIVALAQNTAQILCLKTGKMRPIHEAKNSLRNFIEYYFMALETPSPLLAGWADGLLRRGAEVLDKKMKESRLEDPVFDWVMARYELPSAAALCAGWGLSLQQIFAPLVALYPVRGKHAEI